MTTKPVAAVVVTYNRLGLLKENVQALLAQTVINKMDIVVVDNASTDGTAEWIDEIKSNNIVYVNTGANLGGAGGFQYGIRYAVEHGYQYSWIMDDDCIPTPTALEKLLAQDAALTGSYGFLASRVLWKDGSDCVMNTPRKTLARPLRRFDGVRTRIAMASFVSLLIPSQVVLEVGLPIKEFFIWTDDWEYTRRISRLLPCYYISDSIVIHKSNANIGADIATDKEDRLSRYRYLYRNDVYLYRREGLSGLLYEAPRLLVHTIRTIFSKSPGKIRRLSAIYGGTLDGIHFNPPIEYPIRKKD